jgi:RNA-binding protein
MGWIRVSLDFLKLTARSTYELGYRQSTWDALVMEAPTLTGRQKSHLRGLGQRLEPCLKVGKGGLTTAFFVELGRQLKARELVKLRFLGADRDERAALCAEIEEKGGCVSLGTVGHVGLFYRQNHEANSVGIAAN